MPTPIGHALAGIAVAGLSSRAGPGRMQHAVWLAFFAAAPDLDLVLGFVDGANHHRGGSHSVAAAALAGIAALALRRLGLVALPGGFVIGVAWASHVVLDYLGLDTAPPVGEMALWPFSSAFFASPVALFYDVPRSFSWAAIAHNAVAVTIELALLGPIASFCWHRRRRSPAFG